MSVVVLGGRAGVRVSVSIRVKGRVQFWGTGSCIRHPPYHVTVLDKHARTDHQASGLSGVGGLMILIMQF